MPLYLFQIDGEDEFTSIELPRKQDAWGEAMRVCAEKLSHADLALLETPLRVRVYDQFRSPLIEVTAGARLL